MKLATFLKLNLMIMTTAVCTNIYSQDTQIDPLTSEVTTSRPDTGNVTPTPQEDKIITESIRTHIKNSAILSKLNIDVQTNQGVVTLSGNVDSDSQTSSLIELAQSIIGVKDINADNLKVANSQQPFTDMMITAKIKGLLIREDIFGTKDIASVNMSVETKNGVVYLTGAVDNQEQVKNAIKLIEGVDGVKKVEYKFQKIVPITNSGNTSMPSTETKNSQY